MAIQIIVEQTPASLDLVAGGEQEGEVAQPLPLPVTFRVTDPGGSAIVGAEVHLSVVQGGGSVPAPTVTVGTGGLTATAWTLGTNAAQPQELTATIAELVQTVTAVASAGPPVEMVAVSGDAQTGLAGELLTDSLSVVVRDLFDNPVSGTPVDWSVVEGAGEVVPAQAVTSTMGTSTVAWLPGVGSNQVEATVAGLEPVTFVAEGLPNGVIAGSVTVVNRLLSVPGSLAAVLDGVWADVRSGSGVRAGGAGRLGPEGRVSRAGFVPLRDLVDPDILSAPIGPVTAAGAGSLSQVVPREWVVHLRDSVLGTPLPVPGMPALSAAVSRGDAMRAALDGVPVVAAARVRIEGVSPVLRAVRISIPEGEDEDAALAALRVHPMVEAVEPVVLMRSDALDPEHSGFADGLFYPRQSWHYGMVGLPRAWVVTEGSSEIIVAVVDDGIRFDHPSVAPGLTQDGYDFVTEFEPLVPHCSGGTVSNTGDGDGPDPDPTIPMAYSWNGAGQCAQGPNASGGHGLHVAGTIAASAVGVAGIAPNVRVRPVRGLGTIGFGKSYDLAQGILYAAGLPADDGQGGVVQAPSMAHVINLSFGGSAPDQVTSDAVAAAQAAGALIVASAGNSGSSEPRYPAAYPGVVAVSAVGPDFELAPYSSFGSWVGIAAPGGNVGQYGFSGGGIWSSYWDFTTNDPLIAVNQGTSMAAPHVAGVAALVLSMNPGMTAAQVRERLTATAAPIGSEFQFGAGLVDAFRAVTGGVGLPSTLGAMIFDAASGERLRTQTLGPDGAFRFAGLTDGDYLVYAGEDDRDDGVTGRPGFRWGARGGSANPVPITISGHGEREGSLEIAFPAEAEPNDLIENANRLPVGGYLYGSITPSSDQDHYRVHVPAAGNYTFETDGVFGMCGFGLEADTILELLDEDGQLLATNDDIDFEGERYCSRIAIQLTPGVYFLRVGAWANIGGSYSVRVY